MAPVKLVLNTRKEPLWICHEDWRCSFSVDDPGPKEIEIDKLPPLLAERINNAIAFGVLVKVNGEEEKPFFPFAPPDAQVKEEADREKAVEILSNKLKAIKAEVKELEPNLSNLKLLKALLGAEKAGKARKTIISVIREKVEDVGGEVAMMSPTAAYNLMIEDSDEEVIKCDTQDIVIIEGEEK